MGCCSEFRVEKYNAMSHEERMVEAKQMRKTGMRIVAAGGLSLFIFFVVFVVLLISSMGIGGIIGPAVGVTLALFLASLGPLDEANKIEALDKELAAVDDDRV